MVVSIFLCPSSCLTRRMSLVWSYFMVAKWCRRFRIGMFLSCGWLSFLASRFLILRHTSPILREEGNGLSVVYLWRYVLRVSAVCGLSLNERELCPLHPSALMIPCSVSTWFLFMVANSIASNPVSSRIVKIVAYFYGEAEIILCMFSVVGISGILRSALNLGFSHSMLLTLVNH